MVCTIYEHIVCTMKNKLLSSMTGFGKNCRVIAISTAASSQGIFEVHHAIVPIPHRYNDHSGARDLYKRHILYHGTVWDSVNHAVMLQS